MSSEERKRLWISYAWADNENDDVTFVAQQLTRDLDVQMDRWNLTAGHPLWEQIAGFITNPEKSDGWMVYATQNSLASSACKEELAYALDRALSTRGDTFPLIALFPSAVDQNLIPASIRVRLFVSLTDPDWQERVVSALHGRMPSVNTQEIKPFFFKQHPGVPHFPYVVEVRPRAGVWHPFAVAVPVTEKESSGLALRSGSTGMVPPIAGVVMTRGEEITPDGRYFVQHGFEAATPTNSYYIFFKTLPSSFAFGQINTPGQMHFYNQ